MTTPNTHPINNDQRHVRSRAAASRAALAAIYTVPNAATVADERTLSNTADVNEIHAFLTTLVRDLKASGTLLGD